MTHAPEAAVLRQLMGKLEQPSIGRNWDVCRVAAFGLAATPLNGGGSVEAAFPL